MNFHIDIPLLLEFLLVYDSFFYMLYDNNQLDVYVQLIIEFLAVIHETISYYLNYHYLKKNKINFFSYIEILSGNVVCEFDFDLNKVQ